jgi:hypothetical protein
MKPMKLPHSASGQRAAGICSRWIGKRKASYPTAEAAQSAAAVIKKGYPVLQVSVYDRVGNTDTLVELSVASS